MRRIWMLCALVLSLTASVSTALAAKHSSTTHRARWTEHNKRHQPKHKAKRNSWRNTNAIARVSSADSDPVLFGDQKIETGLDSNVSGFAESFPFTAATSGSARTITTYIDNRSQATTLILGLYSDRSGHPGALLASGKSSFPSEGTWNSVAIPATAITSGSKYWVTLLGRGGTMYFRDLSNGTCRSEGSAQSSLSALASTWKTGRTWATCPVSAYVSGTAAAPLSSSNTPLPQSGGSPTDLLAPVNTTPPVVSGNTTQGQTLTTTNGSWSNLPTGYAYAWQDCDASGNSCTTITGATGSSYTLATADAGHTIRSVVTASNLLGSGTASSSPTATVIPLAPVNTAAPSVSGTAKQGQTLATTNGTWSNSPASYAYQWRDCDGSGNSCANISGATSSSYTLASGDVGHTIRVVVTAANAGGSASATAAQTGVVTSVPPAAPSNTALPTISGSTVQGQALNSSSGTWTGSPTSYAYQWRECDGSGNSCANISGATSSSYTLASGDVGHTIRVVVTAANAGGSASATSSQTAAVTAPSSNANCAGAKGSGVVSQSSLDACGLPSMNTTGPAAGTAFTASSGFTASTAGQVYNGLNVNGEIRVNASNVTIQNSNITAVDPDTAAIKVANGVTGVKIVNDSIHGTNAVQSGSLAFAVSYFGSSINGVTIDHTNFYNGDRILAGYGTVTNSYCLGGAKFNSSSGSEEHDECIYTDGGAPGIRAIHDTLINAMPDQTAAIFVDNPDYGGGGDDGVLDVENSLLAGGDYCLYGGDGKGKTPKTGAETIINNRFSQLFYSSCGNYGPSAYMPSGATWSGNVWDDNNQADPDGVAGQ